MLIHYYWVAHFFLNKTVFGEEGDGDTYPGEVHYISLPYAVANPSNYSPHYKNITRNSRRQGLLH